MPMPLTCRPQAVSYDAPSGHPETETERVCLRQFTPADLDGLAAIMAKPEVMRHLGLRGEPMPRWDTEVVLSGMVSHWSRHGYGRWAAEDKASGRLIGFAGLRSFGRTQELIYLLDRPYWGRGLATEMARECLRFCFAEKRFDEVVAFARPGNLASRRVLEKVGLDFGGEDDFLRLMAAAGLEPTPSGEGIRVAQYSLSRQNYLCSW